MKLEYKVNLVSLGILCIVAFSIAAMGAMAIMRVSLDLNRQIMQREARNLVEEVHDAHAVLKESGVADVQSYVQRAQTDLLNRFRHYRFRETGTVMILSTDTQQMVLGMPLPDPGLPGACLKTIMAEKSGDLTCEMDNQARYLFFQSCDEWHWKLILSITMAELNQARDHFLARVGTILAAALILGSSLFIWLAGRLVRPILQLVEATTLVSRGEWDIPLPVNRSRDEIGQLGLAFGRMADRLAESHRRQAAHVAQLEASRMALQESESRFRALVETSSDIIWELDQEGDYTYISPQVTAVLGYTPGELIGRCPDELAESPAADFRQMVARGQASIRLERTCQHRDGHAVVIETSALRFSAANGAFLGYRGIDRDISERKQAEQENRRLHEQLLHAQRMESIGTLAGGIAHDFNNLLQAIMGSTELLQMDLGDQAKYRTELGIIGQTAQRGAELSRQLLTFSRKIESQLRPIDLVHEVKKARQVLSRTIPKMIDISVTNGDGAHIINGDPSQIEQTLVNMALNAKDAMPDGGALTFDVSRITLTPQACYGLRDARPGCYVRLTVTDTGSGIPADIREKIFDPFFTTKGLAEGTGLGLAMVYGIVQNHSGFITCDSQPGEGTAFALFFPALDRVAAFEAQVSDEALAGGTETVLLVDDEPALRDLGSAMLTRMGYRVMTASSGNEALSIYGELGKIIDLVILDLIMPGMDGMHCLERLRAMDADVKVLISSGYSEQLSRQRCLAAGARDFVSKPYQLNRLLTAVRQILDA